MVAKVVIAVAWEESGAFAICQARLTDLGPDIVSITKGKMNLLKTLHGILTTLQNPLLVVAAGDEGRPPFWAELQQFAMPKMVHKLQHLRAKTILETRKYSTQCIGAELEFALRKMLQNPELPPSGHAIALALQELERKPQPSPALFFSSY